MNIIKRKQFQMQLNNLKKLDDPTKLHASFIIFDFGVSGNNAVIDKDLALEIAPTILNMPLVTKYYKVDEPNTPTDALGGHEAILSEDRNGNAVVDLATTPIGVFSSEGYIMDYVTPSGETIEVLAADAILWKSRFSDACDLIIEWFENGVNVNTSCEILYKNYSFKDGIQYMESPAWFDGHCILNSEVRGDHDIVLPAYENAKLLNLNQVEQFERLVAQAMNKEKEEGEKMTTFKKVFELSHSDIRSLIYKAFDETLPTNTYSYISEVYDDHFIVNEYDSEGETDKYFKVEYVKDGDSVSVNTETKAEVFLKRDWVEITTQEVQTQLNEMTVEKEGLELKVTEFETSLNEVKSSKELIEEKFNSASETIVQLNTVIEELKPIQEQFEKDKFEKALNEKKEYYSAKFEAVGATEQFESEDVQTLLASAIIEGDEGKDAILKLSTMLVDLVQTEVIPSIESPTLRELSSKRENLLPKTDDFESRYK